MAMDKTRLHSAFQKLNLVELGVVFCLTTLFLQDTSGCDDGWSLLDNNCYILIVNPTPYYHDVLEARRECLKRGTDIATIRNQTENDFLKAILQDSDSNEAYIALCDTMNEGEFLLYDGTKPTYTNWKRNEPNNYKPFGGENCVSMISTGEWNDVTCLFNPRNISGVFCKGPEIKPPSSFSPGSFQEKFNMVKGSYMMNNTILSTNVPTYADCMRLCSQDIMCLSVNYNRYGVTDYNCILSSHSRLMSRNLTSDSTVAGFDVKEWTYYEQQFKGP